MRGWVNIGNMKAAGDSRDQEEEGREGDGRKFSNNVCGTREMTQVKNTGCSEPRFNS